MTVHSAPDKDSKASDKRVRILSAAERVFARRGFFASRVSEIAKDAAGNDVRVPSFNSVYMMADPGARGSAQQPRPLAGMRGPTA